jgi:hypothetical protein
MLVGLAGTAGAKTLNWNGTLALDLGALPSVTTQGTGVATVNASSGLGPDHLSTLFLQGGITGTGIAVVTDPDTTGNIPSIRLTATLGTGSISGIAAQSAIINGNNKLPVKGLARICTILGGSQGCDFALPLGLTKNNGNTGVGVGGLLTLFVGNTLLISIEAAPWTLAPGSGVNQTANGAFQTLTRTGFAHGPASNNSSTNLDSGVVQLISPQTVSSIGLPANNENLSLFSSLTLHYVPEPGLILLIGSGVVGLGLLGRSRLRK